MPYLNLKIAGSFHPGVLDELARVLTRITGERLGKDESVTTIAVDRVPAAAWFVGGRPLAPGASAFFLHVTVTEQTNTAEEKAAFLRASYEAARVALFNVHPASYIVVHESRADAWGYGGVTQKARREISRVAPAPASPTVEPALAV